MMFDRAIYLNLPAASERRARFEANVAGISWPERIPRPERFEAIPADSPVLPPVPRWWREGPAWWGCTQSHVAAWRQALDDGCESLVIFEDDALFEGDFAERAECFLAAVPYCWGLLYLGGKWMNPYRHKPVPVNAEVLSVSHVGGTYAYAITADTMRRAIPWVTEEMPRLKTQQIDQRLGIMQASVHAYAPWQWCVAHGEGVSQINGKPNPTEWFDLRQDVLRKLVVPPCSSSSNGLSAARPTGPASGLRKLSIPNPSNGFNSWPPTSLRSKSETSGSSASEPSSSL